MGSFIGFGMRQFYVEEDGTVWDSPRKMRQFDPVTYQPIDFTAVQINTKSATVSQLVVEDWGLKCPECGFEAKSNAGLAVHKMKHENQV
jgi:hypothetical protein